MITDPTQEPIMIVEDSEDDIFLLQRALKRNNARGHMSVVNDGQEAIDYLRGLPPYDDREKYPFPQLIYSDLKMPRVNGFELLEWLKTHTECSVIPLIIFTASNEESDIKRAFELGANAYLVKPSGLDELADMINKSMQFWAISQKPVSPYKCD